MGDSRRIGDERKAGQKRGKVGQPGGAFAAKRGFGFKNGKRRGE
jgi:hypothetical protein